MNVYDEIDYKQSIKAWVEKRPGGGRGEYRKMATQLKVSSTMISQVVNGDKHFSAEVASELCDYFSLSEKEAEHFLLLVEYARAGTHQYRERLKKRIDDARAQAQKLSSRVRPDKKLTETEAATFYSSWIPAGVVHLIALDNTYTAESLALRMGLPRQTLGRVLNFLMESGVISSEGDTLVPAMQHLYLQRDSPFVPKHHQNWRLQGFNRMAFASEKDLFYTAPMSLSEEVAIQMRKELLDLVVRMIHLVGPSKSETARCLNIDWFEF